MQTQKLRPYFFLALLLAATVLAASVLAPFLKPLALAAIFAVVLQGLYRTILRALGNREGLAAFATILVSALVVLVPLTALSFLIATQAAAAYASLEADGGATLASLGARVSEALGGVPALSAFSANLEGYAREVLQWIAANAGAFVSSVSSFLLSSFIFLIALYYLLRDGARVRATLIALSPLGDTEDEKVFDRLERAVNSVIKGNFLVALTQGAVSAIGYTFFGIPNAILWGALTAGAALIPGVGTALVFLPLILFLFFTGAIPAALGLLLWGVLAVGLIDNLLGPKLVGKGMQLHPLLVLLSVLGGVALFGPIGIFLGPLSLTLLFALLSLYADISRAA